MTEPKIMTRDEFHSLTSDYSFEVSWSNGGTHNDCWGNSYSSSADEPLALTEHLDFLCTFFPEVTIRTVCKIQEAVSFSTKTYSDYYGGSTSESRIYIDRDTILRILVEDDYIEIVSE